MKATIAQVYIFLSARNIKRANEILESAYAEKIKEGTADEETELVYKQMKISIVKEMGDFESALEIYLSMDLPEDHESFYKMHFERSELLLSMNKPEEALSLLDELLLTQNLDIIAHGSYLLHIFSSILQAHNLSCDSKYIEFIQRFADNLGIEGYELNMSNTSTIIETIEELLWRESDSGYRFSDLLQDLKKLEEKTEKVEIIQKFILQEPLSYYRNAAERIDQSEW